MNERTTKNPLQTEFIAIADSSNRIDPDWMRQTAQQWNQTPKALDSLPRSAETGNEWLNLLCRIAPLNDCHPVLVLRSGLQLPAYWRERLESVAILAPIVLAGNYPGGMNPALDVPETCSASDVDRWIWACSNHQAVPISDFPLQCIYFPRHCLQGSKRPSTALLLDSIFVYDPSRKINAGSPANPAIDTALGPVRIQLRSYLQSSRHPVNIQLPYFGLDKKPVTLHISHDWGGGVMRWIDDVMIHDQENNHLKLVAGGDKKGRVHGQFLRLLASSCGAAEIREASLTPSIADSTADHHQYRELIRKWTRRFSVSRVVISSLIGHSLEIMETGLPTAQILHDYYPVWPVLDLDPLDFIRADGSIDIERATALSKERVLFDKKDETYWRELKTAWKERVGSRKVALIAPTEQVRHRWSTIANIDRSKIHVINHGFSGWSEAVGSITPKPREDGRLNLVAIGRLSSVKGLDLLSQSLDRVTRHGHLTLVGCGRGGMRFFGRSGVDVIMDYEHQSLPSLLRNIGPQAALFLSAAPETWNYVLSECRNLGIPPIATRRGSFIERIKHEEDGWLFDASPEALESVLRALHKHPGLLKSVAKHGCVSEPTIEQTLIQYGRVVPAADPIEITCELADAASTVTGRWAAMAFNQARELVALQDQLAEQSSELAERTQWAIRYQRLAEERTQWARSLDDQVKQQAVRESDLNGLLEERTKWAISIEGELEERTHWAKALEKDLEERTEWAISIDRELEERTRWAKALEKDLEERTRWAKSLEREFKHERSAFNARLDHLETERNHVESALINARADLASSQDQLSASRRDLDQSREKLNQSLQALSRSDQELSNHQELLSQIFASRSWRWTRPLRFFNRVVDNARHRQAFNPLRWPRLARRLIHSLRFHGLHGTLHLAQGAPPPALEHSALPVVETPAEYAPVDPVSLPVSSRPLASVIIPVFNKVAYTAACLESLRSETGDIPFEVIVVDDCSSDGTANFLGRCEGLEVVRNLENSGFIASCNAGAARARGKFLVFLNNDTTVTEGWLESLLETFKDFPDAGIVGARLAYPDGRLQEAGGIIFADASGWNYGRNEDPALPQYNFTSEADYVSGACLAIRRDLFEELGGFDSHYAPAYYEDTDLCFRVRHYGRKVYCQPACTIIHHEGVSSGTDESTGTKRYQAVNRDKFSQRWADELSRQPPHKIDSDRSDPVRRARFHRTAGRALVIDATTPMPDHDSGSVRMTAMLELMVEQNWRVTFCPQNLKWEGRYSRALQRKSIEVLSAPAMPSLEKWLKAYGNDLDLVLVSRHYVLAPFLATLRRACPKAKIVFDTVDLHFLREQRQAELDDSASMKAAAERTRKAELGLMTQSDITLVVSPVEQKLLADLLPEADIRVLSNIHSLHGCQQPWSARRDLMFVGGFQHPPNIDAAEWLIDEIFPIIRAELPDVKLHLIGSRMPDALRERASPGIMIHGFVEDLTPYLNGCRLSLAPLRYGAGVKGKVNQAMAWGLPVVATACAAEGMFLRDGEDVRLAEDSTGFAAQVIRVYRDAALWQRLSDGGLANVEQYFSRRAAGDVVQGLLSESSPGTIN